MFLLVALEIFQKTKLLSNEANIGCDSSKSIEQKGLTRRDGEKASVNERNKRIERERERRRRCIRAAIFDISVNTLLATGANPFAPPRQQKNESKKKKKGKMQAPQPTIPCFRIVTISDPEKTLLVIW